MPTAKGLIHRDIKPANIMLTGAAGGADRLWHRPDRRRHALHGLRGDDGHAELHGAGAGLDGAQCDARSDIYSLGIVLYEILTRRPPFDADTPLAIVIKHLNDPLPLPRKVKDPTIPGPFERVVLKALAKRPRTATRPPPR